MVTKSSDGWVVEVDRGALERLAGCAGPLAAGGLDRGGVFDRVFPPTFDAEEVQSTFDACLVVVAHGLAGVSPAAGVTRDEALAAFARDLAGRWALDPDAAEVLADMVGRYDPRAPRFEERQQSAAHRRHMAAEFERRCGTWLECAALLALSVAVTAAAERGLSGPGGVLAALEDLLGDASGPPSGDEDDDAAGRIGAAAELVSSGGTFTLAELLSTVYPPGEDPDGLQHMFTECVTVVASALQAATVVGDAGRGDLLAEWAADVAGEVRLDAEHTEVLTLLLRRFDGGDGSLESRLADPASQAEMAGEMERRGSVWMACAALAAALLAAQRYWHDDGTPPGRDEVARRLRRHRGAR